MSRNSHYISGAGSKKGTSTNVSCSCSCSTSGSQSGKSCAYCSSVTQSKGKSSASTSYTTTTDFEEGIESTIGSKIFHAVDDMVDVALSQANQLDTQYVSGSGTASSSFQSKQQSLNTTYVSGSSAISNQHSSLVKNGQSGRNFSQLGLQSTSSNQGLPSIFGHSSAKKSSINTTYISGSSAVKSTNPASKVQSRTASCSGFKSCNKSTTPTTSGMNENKNRMHTTTSRRSFHK